MKILKKIRLTSIWCTVSLGFRKKSSCVVIISKILWPRTANRSLSWNCALHASRRDLWVKTSRIIWPVSFGRSGSSSGIASRVCERFRLRVLCDIPRPGSGVDSMAERATLWPRRRGGRDINNYKMCNVCPRWIQKRSSWLKMVVVLRVHSKVVTVGP